MNSMMEEQIQIYGYKTTYILKTHNTLDDLYGESIGSIFKNSFEIEMMPENPDEYSKMTHPYLYVERRFGCVP